MAFFQIMPRQGQSVESCIITTWHKKKGDAVSEGDILFSYETDKSAFDEPSQASGVILHVFADEGDVVPCLEPVCIIGKEGEDISELLSGSDAAAKEADNSSEDSAEAEAMSEKTEFQATSVNKADGRVFISPRAKNLALKSGVDMTKVTASGPHGRIIERDIEKALDLGFSGSVADVEAFLRGELVTVADESPAAEVKDANVPASEVCDYTEAPMSNIRKVISRTMHASLSEMAQLTLNSSFNASALLEYRANLKASGEALGLGKITINDMVMYAAAKTLMNHPLINANLIGDTVRTFNHVNLGVAVDTDRGLLVPVIKHADELSLSMISSNSKALASKARDGALTPDEMSGGSFTVTNLGSLGIESFTPVINPPQVAILGVCAVTQRVDEDGDIYPAMGLSLTFDHRAVDGAPAARFLKELCTALENFELLLAK